MPSTKKRVNLTIPDEVYEKLQAYKADNALENDATACLQLIVLQLRAQENAKAMFNVMRNISKEDMLKYSAEGLDEIYKDLDKLPK